MKTYLFVYSPLLKYEVKAPSFKEAVKMESFNKEKIRYDRNSQRFYSLEYKEVYRIQGTEKLRVY